MGLDGVELIIAVEERFGIAILDEEASRVRTVGDLHELLMKKLTPAESRACLTSQAFQRMRRALVDHFGITREAVRPKALLEGLLPQSGRRKAWAQLAVRLGWQLPELRRPAALELGLAASCLAAVPAALVLGALDPASQPLAWGIGLGALPFCWLGYRLTAPLAVHLPSSCATVGGAVRTALSHNFSRISQECRSWSQREVWQSLQIVIVDQIGCSVAEVRKDARFVEDLGID